MRPCSPSLAAYLAANDTFVITDLYTFALATGEVLRYSGWTTPLAIPGTAFPAGSLNYDALSYTDFPLGPRFGRSKVTTKTGVAPTELDIDILAGAADVIGTFPFAEAVRVGLFDGATVELDRFFAPATPASAGSLDTSLGAIVWFTGRVADTEIGRLHRDAERYLEGLTRHASEIPAPLPGDIALFRFGRTFSHGAIVTQWPLLIHAYWNIGVVRGDATLYPLAGRPVKFFTPFQQ
jgi:hypothetical protein